ncbi:MAG: toprim domain-containing protein [Phocaeicola sp.]
MNEVKIITLTDREKCRERLPVWFGTRALDGALHSFREILNNSVDEIYNNFPDGEIHVTHSSDLKRLTVTDTGRGLPLEGLTDGIENFRLLFLTLFAGGNFENEKSGTESVGQNGCGTAVCCHTSTLFRAESWKNGRHATFETLDGGLTHTFVVDDSMEFPHGSRITWQLDDEVYDTIELPSDKVHEITHNIAANCPNIRFSLNGEQIHYTSLSEFADTYFEDVVGSKVESTTSEWDIVLATTIDGEGRSYINRNWLREGGSINDGVVNGAKLFFNKYLRENVKKSTPLKNSDVETVLSFATHLKTVNPEYSGQIKLSTESAVYKTSVQDAVQHALEVELAKNEGNVKKMVEALLESQKLNGKNSAARAKLTKALTAKIDSTMNRIEGLVDCKYAGDERSEIFFSEGNSAAGSVIAARDSNYQASFPLKGKLLNVNKIQADKAFENTELMNIARILGCGIETKHKEFGAFDISKLRYGKIILAVDGDVDGTHISTLLINFFVKFMPELILQGRVYVALAPLLEIELSDGSYLYANSQAEGKELMDGKRVSKVSYLKGLGEIDAETMSYTTVDPDTRRILQVTARSKNELGAMCKKWFGTDVNLRRDDIINNFKEVSE